MGISSVNGGSPITDTQLDVVVQMDQAITDPSATVTINGDHQLNVVLDTTTDQVKFNHAKGNSPLNSKGEPSYQLQVSFSSSEIVEITVAYGQSNTFGWKTGDLNTPNTVNQSSSDILMLNSAKTALVAATDQITSDLSASLDSGDTDCMIDYANYFRQYYNSRGTNDLENVLQVAGAGSSTILDLASGTTPFTNWQNDFSTICTLITNAGKVPHVTNILYTQGEREVNTNTVSGWASRLVSNIYDPMVSYIKTTTGQTDDPIMQVVALSMHSTSNNFYDTNLIALEQLSAMELRPGKIKTTVFTGHMTHTADGIHLAGDAQRYMRQMQAKYAAYTDLMPLQVQNAKRSGSNVELYIKGGTGNLQFDYSLHSSTTAKGIRVFNSSSAAVTVNSVTLDNVNRRVVVALADGGTNGPYTIDGSYFSNNQAGGGQYHANIVPIVDSDSRKGTLSDCTALGNADLWNPLMPFNLTVEEP